MKPIKITSHIGSYHLEANRFADITGQLFRHVGYPLASDYNSIAMPIIAALPTAAFAIEGAAILVLIIENRVNKAL